MDRRSNRGAPVFMVSPKLSGTRGHADVRKFTMSASFPACNGSMSTQRPGAPRHTAYAAQMLKLRRTQEFQLPRCLQQFANEVGGHPGPTSPSGRAVDHRRQARASFVLVGRAPMCPKHRSTAVINGQQRFVTAPLELHYQPSAGGPRELPKLAVRFAGLPWPDRTICVQGRALGMRRSCKPDRVNQPVQHCRQQAIASLRSSHPGGS
jgi:hypothetical protein